MTRSTAALAARGLSVGYRDHVVIDGLDLSIAAGRVTALCGPNGCGKSTLLRTLAGLQPARAGHVEVNGQPLASFRRRALARELTMLAQFNQIPSGLTVREPLGVRDLEERRVRAPGSALRRRVLDVERFLPAERERVGRHEERASWPQHGVERIHEHRARIVVR